MPDINTNRNEQNIEKLDSSRSILQPTDSPIAHLENQIHHWQSLLEATRCNLETQRKVLAKILLTKDEIILRIAKRKEMQAHLDDCIKNPAAHPELKPGDIEKYIKLLPLDKQRLAVFTIQLTERNKQQQECESNIVILENEMTRLKAQLAANLNLIAMFNNPHTFFAARTHRLKIDITTEYCTRIDSIHKPRQ